MHEHSSGEPGLIPEGPAGDRRRDVARNTLRAMLDIATHAVIAELPSNIAPTPPWDFEGMVDLAFNSDEGHASRFAVALLAERKATQMIDELPMPLRADVLAVQMEDDIRRNEERGARAAAEQAARDQVREAERDGRARRYAEAVSKRADFPARFAAFQEIYRPPRKK
ncbi:MAG: hypothetical protein ACRC20_01685 [Segniliparus sp.]|uniref:hypothetical protein n=1 Tax=Segniliparus sp. TaxID=2804064 RepID=UPI003F317859